MNMQHCDCSLSLSTGASLSFNLSLSTDHIWHLIIVSISTTPSKSHPATPLLSAWLGFSELHLKIWPLHLQSFTLPCLLQPQVVNFPTHKGVLCQLINFLWSLSFSSKAKSLPIPRFSWQTVGSPRTAPPSGHRQEPRTPPVPWERMVSPSGHASLVLRMPPPLPPTPKRMALMETCPRAMKLLQVGIWNWEHVLELIQMVKAVMVYMLDMGSLRVQWMGKSS